MTTQDEGDQKEPESVLNLQLLATREPACTGGHVAKTSWTIDIPPWHPSYYLSLRGAENLHIYVWCLKDISWAQEWFWLGWISGFLAIAWAVFLTGRALRMRCVSEIIHVVAQTMWLCANFWWMWGEFHDLRVYGTWGKMYYDRAEEASHLMTAALALLGVHYLILRPFGLLKHDRQMPAVLLFNRPDLKPRFQFYFHDWREYENVHIVFWLLKDLSWTATLSVPWTIFVIPTVLVAVDFVYKTHGLSGMLVEHIHYIVTFCWVMANATWALDDMFYPDQDLIVTELWQAPVPMENLRWWCCWWFVLAFILLLALYAVWLPATCLGRAVETHPQWAAAAHGHPDVNFTALEDPEGMDSDASVQLQIVNPISSPPSMALV